MCNLYRLSSSRTEVASFFDVDAAGVPPNTPEEIYPGYPGTVVADSLVQQMVWGFPLPQKGAKGQPLKPKPVNNARSDKLASPFWRDSFVSRRCLIPASAYAEASGIAGAKTRTWLSQADQEMFAIAGIWRGSPEWGAAYSMIITDCSPQVASVHHRMPVILDRGNWRKWLTGTPEDAYEMCVPFAGELAIEATQDPWVMRR